MGGWSSGRYRTRNAGAVEATLRIDMRALRRRGFLKPGCTVSGSWGWNLRGEACASVCLAVELDEPDGGGVLRLDYGHAGVSRCDSVSIIAAPCRYGGHRFYFVCPITGARCEVLAFAHGRWASRQAQKLTYYSQSEDTLSRLYRARGKAEARAFGMDGNPSPRAANRERLLARWKMLENAADALFISQIGRRFERHGLSYPEDF